MRPIEVGATFSEQVMPKNSDLASALGNSGVDVVSSPATIGYLEMAALRVIEPYFEDDEATVGIGFNFRHLSAAFLDAPLDVNAELIAQDGRRFTFKVEASQHGRLIMTGEHERAVVNLGKFLSRDKQ